MLIFFVAVVSVFGGIILAALGVFCFQFYRSLQRLNAAASTIYDVLKPLSQDKLLPDFLMAMRKLSAQGSEIVKGLESITKTVQIFNRLAMGEGAQAAAAASAAVPSVGTESAFIAPTEEEFAVREEQEELRKRGIETAEENMIEPDISQMNVANV